MTFILNTKLFIDLLIKSGIISTKIKNMAAGNNYQKGSKSPNPLEIIKDIGKQTAGQMKHEATQIPRDFIEQLLGIKIPQKQKFSGELNPGETLQINEVLSGRYEETVKQKNEARMLLQMEREERQRIEEKTGELKIQIKAIQQEIIALSKDTHDLAQETQVAAMQAPIEPGVYHLTFFEKLLEFIKSFRKKINQSFVWLHEANKRASKKNVWAARFAKLGAKYLLSSEHYIQRQTG